ncbi:Crp/Fnr family transcriptional regulator [Acidobacteria bacterium AH-259-D05]|nr:Crp/Fnr family transcriptional regulator [Acidobacteria bacterium AH-259-D05]
MSTTQLQCEELVRVDRIWHLRRTGLLDGLSLFELTTVVSACREQIYSKGEIIFHQGDPADSLFILNRGCVRISIVNSNDQEKILGIYMTGDIFGENVLGPQNCFRTQATAHEESWVSIISRDHIASLIQQRACVALNYIRILNERLLEARQDLGAHSFLNTERRLGRTLLKLADTRGKPIFGKKNMLKLNISLPHQQLARLVGGNRPHISTIMSKFKKQGWVLYDRRKLLINVKELERVFGSPEESPSQVQ